MLVDRFFLPPGRASRHGRELIRECAEYRPQVLGLGRIHGDTAAWSVAPLPADERMTWNGLRAKVERYAREPAEKTPIIGERPLPEQELSALGRIHPIARFS